MKSIHFSQIILAELLSFAQSKNDRDLAKDRTKHLLEALESNNFLIIHNDVITDLMNQMDAMEKQNQELSKFLSEPKPQILRVN